MPEISRNDIFNARMDFGLAETRLVQASDHLQDYARDHPEDVNELYLAFMNWASQIADEHAAILSSFRKFDEGKI